MGWQVKVAVTRDGTSHLSTSFDRSPITFGARAENDVVLNDPYVSGNHAVIMVSRGQLTVHDKSRNGSFVDGKPVGDSQVLGQGGTVSMPPFEVELAFESDDRAWQTQFLRTPVMASPAADAPAADAPAVDAPAVDAPAVDARVIDAPVAAAPVVDARIIEPPVVPDASPSGVLTKPVGESTPPPLDEIPLDPSGSSKTMPEPRAPVPSSVSIESMTLPEPPPRPPTRDIPVGTAPAATRRIRDRALPTVAATAASLTVVAGPPNLRNARFALPIDQPVVLGRGDSVEIQLPDRTVSRQHARLLASTSGIQVKDLESANGVFVNGERMHDGSLTDGDRLTLGQVSMTLSVSDDTLPTDSAPDDVLPSSGAIHAPPPPPPVPKVPSVPPAAPPVAVEPRAPVSSADLASDATTSEPRLGELSITVQPTDQAHAMVLDVHGPIDGYNYSHLARTLDRVIEGNARCVVVDLEGVDYVGHTALGLLVKALTRLDRKDGQLYLTGVGARIGDAIRLSRLGGRFDACTLPDPSAALADWRDRRS